MAPMGRFKSALRDAVLIMLAGSALGLIYNFLSPDGIPLVGRRPGEALQGIVPEIDLAEAKRGFDSGEALFVDARSPREYLKGHIKGAVNIPYRDFLIYPEIPDSIVEADKLIIYCGSKDCGLDLKLAEQLVSLGITHIEIFSDGWESWSKAGYPVERGE